VVVGVIVCGRSIDACVSVYSLCLGGGDEKKVIGIRLQQITANYGFCSFSYLRPFYHSRFIGSLRGYESVWFR